MKVYEGKFRCADHVMDDSLEALFLGGIRLLTCGIRLLRKLLRYFRVSE